MENDILTKIWNKENDNNPLINSKEIISLASKQRASQRIGMIIMSLTLIIITIYAIIYLPQNFNTFSLGLLLMITAMLVRIVIEWYSKMRKAQQLVALDYKAYKSYLKKYYKMRMLVNYIITPICFGIYCYGLYLLFPHFKREFSQGFYIYLIISGIVSLAVIAMIIINQVVKERRFLKQLLR